MMTDDTLDVKITDSTQQESDELVTNKDSEAINEIEEKIAEDSEKTQEDKVEAVMDYSNFDLEQLVAELRKLLKENPVEKIGKNVTEIKSVFNVKFGELINEVKKKFLEEGGEEIDFKFSTPLKKEYNDLLFDYKIKRKNHYDKLEESFNQNLKIKLGLIERLKDLIDNHKGGNLYSVYKEINETWKKTGLVPKANYRDLWQTYQHHVERFYDLLDLDNNLRAIDFKHNLEEKQKLIDRAKEIAAWDNIKAAFNELQLLHKIWKEEVGPVPREHREDIWAQFNSVTKEIHEKRDSFYKEMQSKYDEAISNKEAIIEKINALNIDHNKSMNDWNKTTKELESLRSMYLNSAPVPRKVGNELWEKLRVATHRINHKKNNFFKIFKKEQLENLTKKRALLEQANALKDSVDWNTTTEKLKELQATWKTIGSVPRKFSNIIWKDFQEACNQYFNRYFEERDAATDEEKEAYKQKEEIYKELESKIASNDSILEADFETYILNWNSIGKVAYKQRSISNKFFRLIEKATKTDESIDRNFVDFIKFKNTVQGHLESEQYRKVDSERSFISGKIDETVRKIKQFENNISFISNVKEGSPILDNVNQQIDRYKEDLSLWKKKRSFLNSLDY